MGGEKIADHEESRCTGTAVLTPGQALPISRRLLKYGEIGAFDIYNWLSRLPSSWSCVSTGG